MKDASKPMRRQTCLTAARKMITASAAAMFSMRIERYFDLTWPPLRLHNPQRQTDTDQRMTNACDDRLQFVQDVLRHVLVAVAQGLDPWAASGAAYNPKSHSAGR